MNLIKSILMISILFSNCKENTNIDEDAVQILGTGSMPSAVPVQGEAIHLVYGLGDSLLYSVSTDKGNSFSKPFLIATIPGLAASHMRGPQIAHSKNGIAVIASNQKGDVFSLFKPEQGNWTQPVKLNDVDTVAKEGFLALDGDGLNCFAVWLDLRKGHNQLFGSRSTDGGLSWSGNRLVYASPDSTICECCKPSVKVSGNHVYVMFRNWLNGNRDLYLVESRDGGDHFETAEKLGNGTWPLNGCPMDGGGLAIDNNGNPQTVWNRMGTIYACEPGKQETALGKGRNCTLASVNGKNIYAWVEEGEVVVMKDGATKLKLGKGQLPFLKALDEKNLICIWQNESSIMKALIRL